VVTSEAGSGQAGQINLNHIRIVLLDMPPLLLEMLRDAIAPQCDMEIVGTVTDEPNLGAFLENAEADVVVVKRDGALKRTAVNELLYRRPRLRIFEIVDRGRRGLLHELRPRRVALGEISPQRLINAIRSTGEQPENALHA
jgi:DNA-binding NarL/FixJ family response regulator